MKQQWEAHLEIVEQYTKDLKKFVHDLPEDGETETASGGSNPPTPPPPPPGL